MTEKLNMIFYYILTFFVGLFIISSFFIRAEFNYYLYGDNPILQDQQLWTFLLYVLLLLVVGFLLYPLFRRLNRFSKHIVIPVVLLISFLIQWAIIIYFPVLPTADSLKLLTIASDMLYHADYSAFDKGGYLFRFPYNFSMVLYFKTLLAIFPENYEIIKLFNILFSLITTLFIYGIYKELSPRPKENEYGILIFAAMYLPSLFMCNYVYNDIIATTFFTGAIYFFVSFIKDKKPVRLVTAAILLSGGNYFRNIGAIFLIAAVLYLLLRGKEIGFRKLVASFLILISLFWLPAWAQDTYLQATHKVTNSIYQNSAPVHLWLNMGIDTKRLGFFDHKKSYKIYEIEADYNKERSKELFLEEIKRKFRKATANEIVNMYYSKLIWTWTEGTYQIDRYGIGVDPPSIKNKKLFIMGGYRYSTTATQLFNRDNHYRGSLLWALYVMNFLIYCFIFVRLVRSVRDKRFDEALLVIVILGFVGFYLLWEIKSRYLYPVYPILLILSYFGYQDAYHFLLRRYYNSNNPL